MNDTLKHISISITSLIENDAVQTKKIFDLQNQVHKLMLEYDAKLRGYQSSNEFTLIQNKLSTNSMLSVLSFLTIRELIKLCLVSKRFQILVSKILPQKIQLCHSQNEQLMMEIQELEIQIQNYQNTEEDQVRFQQIKSELYQITKKGINEIKSYNSPPKLLADILKILITVIGKNQKQSWKQFIGDNQFLYILSTFDIQNIDDQDIINLKLSMELPLDRALAISQTGGILLSYLQSLYQLTQHGINNIKISQKNRKRTLLINQRQIQRLGKIMNIIIS